MDRLWPWDIYGGESVYLSLRQRGDYSCLCCCVRQEFMHHLCIYVRSILRATCDFLVFIHDGA